jgi:hypothetical protein
MPDQIATRRPWWLLPPGRIHPLWWGGVAGLLLAIDYATGLYSELPMLYVIPVTLAAWYSGLGTALVLAVGTPLAQLGFTLARGRVAEPLSQVAALTLLRGAVVIVMSMWFARLSQHEREMQRHLEKLEGLLHICAFCKNIRNDRGQWERLEKVIMERSEARFSHGFCPDCVRIHYPEIARETPQAG